MKSSTSRNWRFQQFIFLGKGVKVASKKKQFRESKRENEVLCQEEVADLRNEVGELQTQLLRHQVAPLSIDISSPEIISHGGGGM